MNPDKTSNEDSVRKEAQIAVREIGTNAVPTLLRWNGATDSTFQKFLIRNVDGLPAPLGRQFFRRQIWHTSAFYWHQRAIAGFGLLGTNAASALPALAAQFNSGPTYERQ